MQNKKNSSLSGYPEGGVKDLWIISFPLMIASLSIGLILLFDRLFLAHYSLDTLNAAINSGTMATTFLWGGFVLANISEIFVAQYNGSGNASRLGKPVWQMLWFSFFTIGVFVPMGIWLGPLIYKETVDAELSIVYFRWLMIFGPIVPMIGAISGFFVGQGKARYVAYSAIIASITNIIFDYLLIFGIEGFIPELGIFGAALATGIAQGAQLTYLLYHFLKKENRQSYGVTKWHFESKEFFKCVKIAMPHSLSQTIEVSVWAVLFYWMSLLSFKHLTVMGICQTIFVFFNFFVDGISKGASTISGNLIGAKKFALIWKVWFSGLKLFSLFFALVCMALLIYPEPLIEQFLTKAKMTGIDIDPTDPRFLGEMDQLLDLIKVCLIWLLVYLFFEGMRFLLVGILTAAGDTLFLMVWGSFSVLFFALFPIYYFVVFQERSVLSACIISSIYSLLTFAIYYFRFYNEKWKKINLID